jgi:hypothetical protein
MPIRFGDSIIASGHAQSGLLVACAPINDRTGGEKTTAISFKADDVIIGCYVNVRTLEATSGTKTIDVGLNGTGADDDPDGLLDGVSTAAAAMVKGTLINTGQTLGALLRVDESGAGVLVPEGHVVTSDAPLTYTLGAAHTEVVGDIYVIYFRPQQA